MVTYLATVHIEFMIADGDEIPSPSNLETILSQPDQNEAIAFLIIQITDEIFSCQQEKQLAW
ncbi:type II toxin-antitoxin system HicB family antitoxin [Limnofasciculus baicalensis]|uniref:Type II toxin-antitoxin system HicB family antitoxin n=1 Tax=Limnofasciculus baicalensis BBK-W-15 TaxID=2699891 RepID=A0AAE3GVX7_9CYAN|nr:type II toxin-antitoxin system HicB family antitoxin [Limnofasciculus baicalensis]MCP2730911.1 type II toxin-antitoxin system HicB family antitoxin [Limnofasciculus baicalensis BBK-W-15]